MKTKDKASLALLLAIVLSLFMLAAIVCAMGYAKCWFGHEYDADGICAKCGVAKPAEDSDEPIEDDGGLAMDPVIQGHGMRLSVAKIPQPQYAEEGVSAIAESAVKLTATVTPSDATNKEVDWSVEWNNASSTWAKGKTVTDYVTITPTSDGALTANVECLQAFAEQVIVTVSVRTDSGIYANATVDYEQRVIGIDFGIAHTWEDAYQDGVLYQDALDWSMTTANLNPEVDFMRMPSLLDGSNTFLQSWTMGYDYEDTIEVTFVPQYSIYTKAKANESLTISVAATSEYLAALEAAGFDVTASAGTYKQVWSDAYDAEIGISFLDLMVNQFAETGEFGYFEDYVALRTALRNNVGKTMFQIKLEVEGSEYNVPTIYNVRFSAESVTAIVESITVSPGTITF